MQLERILELSKDIVTVIPIDDYLQLLSVKDKEHIQINLPAADAFSEELKVIITNSKQ